MSHISEFSKCPKCRKQFLKKSSSHTPEFGKEYFCHNCHEYFGILELVHHWGYDVADLYSDEWKKAPHFIGTSSMMEYYSTISKISNYRDWKSNTVSDLYEGDWYSARQRNDGYEVVNEMLQGVDAWNDYTDLMQTQEYALQRGLQ